VSRKLGAPHAELTVARPVNTQETCTGISLFPNPLQALVPCTSAIASGKLSGAKLAEVYRHRGDVYFRMKQYKSAMKDYNKVLELVPEHTRALWNRGNLFYNRGKMRKAFEDYLQAAQVAPDFALAYDGLGLIQMAYQNYDKAIALYNKALELDNSLLRVRANRGTAYQFIGEHQKAVADFTVIIETDKDILAKIYDGSFLEKQWLDLFGTALLNRGESHIYLNENGAALKDITRLLEYRPDHSAGYVVLGRIYHSKHKFAAALENYGKAIRIHKDNGDAYIRRAITYRLLKKFDKSLEDLNYLIKNNPMGAVAYKERSFTKSLIGDFEGAKEDIELSFRLNQNVLINYQTYLKSRGYYKGPKTVKYTAEMRNGVIA